MLDVNEDLKVDQMGEVDHDADQTETTKQVICGTCDGFCPVQAKVKDGRVVRVTPRSAPILKDVLCMKGAFAPKAFAHPDRILHPLKRVGARGDGVGVRTRVARRRRGRDVDARVRG